MKETEVDRPGVRIYTLEDDTLDNLNSWLRRVKNKTKGKKMNKINLYVSMNFIED